MDDDEGGDDCGKGRGNSIVVQGRGKPRPLPRRMKGTSSFFFMPFFGDGWRLVLFRIWLA